MCAWRRSLSAVAAGLVLAVLAPLSAALAQIALPPVARVTDLTGTLTVQQQGAISQTLAAFETRKGSQIAVVIVPTTEPVTSMPSASALPMRGSSVARASTMARS